jgi:hypothetical protein
MSLTAIPVSATSALKNHVNLTHCKPRSAFLAAGSLVGDHAEAMAIRRGSGVLTVSGLARGWDNAAAAAKIPFLTSAFCVAASGWFEYNQGLT